jgi:hypothetical protein
MRGCRVRNLRVLIGIFIIVCVFGMLSKAQAGLADFSGNMTVDNGFNVYISQTNSTAGTLIGSGGDWQTTYNISSQLTPGVTNYLHVEAADWGYIAGFIGAFQLNNPNFRFQNGTQTLLTNTTDWAVYTNGFNNTPGIVTVANGANGVGPWGFRPGIDSNAAWIWTNNGNDI